WSRRPDKDALRWYVADDRGLYRPGEEVKVKGWVRVVGAGKHGDVRALDASAKTATWRLKDAQGNEVAKGARPLNTLGGFDLTVALPRTMNLGAAVLELSAGGAAAFTDKTYTHVFQVEEFRRPEFEVKASASEG